MHFAGWELGMQNGNALRGGIMGIARLVCERGNLREVDVR